MWCCSCLSSRARRSLLESVGVGDHGPVDDVGELALERADGFFGVLAVGAFAVVVLAPLTRVAKLGHRGGMDGPVQLPVAALVQPVPRVCIVRAGQGLLANHAWTGTHRGLRADARKDDR